MYTLAEITSKIKALKDGRTMKQVKQDDIKLYYAIQSLTRKKSEIKAIENKQFVTKEHLTEFKGLIIWLLKNKCNYRGYLNLKDAMQNILNEVQSNKVVYVTERGIKGVISSLTISVGLDTTEEKLREQNGIEYCDGIVGNAIMEGFQQFKLEALM